MGTTSTALALAPEMKIIREERFNSVAEHCRGNKEKNRGFPHPVNSMMRKEWRFSARAFLLPDRSIEGRHDSLLNGGEEQVGHIALALRGRQIGRFEGARF